MLDSELSSDWRASIPKLREISPLHHQSPVLGGKLFIENNSTWVFEGVVILFEICWLFLEEQSNFSAYVYVCV